MTSTNLDEFYPRFLEVQATARRTTLLTISGWSLCILIFGLIGLSVADWMFETSWHFRASTLAVFVLITFLTAAVWLLRMRSRWSSPVVAANLERRFQDLGQSVRTSIQLQGAQPSAEGVSADLLSALQSDLLERTYDLRLTDSITMTGLRTAKLTLLLLTTLGASAVLVSADWRLALFRTLLSQRPYTSIEVSPGTTTVDAQNTLTIDARLVGRITGPVELRTRDLTAGAQEWDSRRLTALEVSEAQEQKIHYSVALTNVERPFEYQIRAGRQLSEVFRVDVRQPLSIVKFRHELIPPEYTRLMPRTVTGGTFDVLRGSRVRLIVELDRAPQSAQITLRPMSIVPQDQPEEKSFECQIEGRQLTLDLHPDADCYYQISAKAADGTQLPPNRFSLRVHRDRAPSVVFIKPEETIEVHSLAEVPIRIKLSDDFNLKRAGVVLQLNNDVPIEFETVEYEGRGGTPKGEQIPLTTLETSLPLEYLELNKQDSVAIYAYAEDNRPGEPNRTVSDLQFIDIRDFRRNFPASELAERLRGLGGSSDGGGRDLPVLADLISEERFVLNRVRQFAHRAEDDRWAENRLPDLVGLQNQLSEFAGQLGDAAASNEQLNGVMEEGRVSDLLYQAQGLMLASVDSLSKEGYTLAQTQVQDALRHLTNARTRIELMDSSTSGGGGRFAGVRRFRDRRRRKRSEQEQAQEIVQRLRAVAGQQDDVSELLMQLVPTSAQSGLIASPLSSSAAILDGPGDMPGSTAPHTVPQSTEALDALRRGVQEEQTRIVADVNEIREMIGKLASITDLAKQRNDGLAQAVAAPREWLERNDPAGAQEASAKASAALRILAIHLHGTTHRDATKRLEVLRDLSQNIADNLRTLQTAMEQVRKSSSGLEDASEARQKLLAEYSAALGSTAANERESARTLIDVKETLVDPERGIADSEDRLVRRIVEIFQEDTVMSSVGRLEQLPSILESSQWVTAAADVADLRDRFDVVAQRLDAFHRELLAPRLEQIRKLEARAVESREMLSSLHSEDHIGRWHARTAALLDDLEEARIAAAQVEDVRDAIRQAAWSPSTPNRWGQTFTSEGHLTYIAPTSYDSSLRNLASELQRMFQELATPIAEHQKTGAIPFQYRPLVDRYFEVLSGFTEELGTDSRPQR